MRAVVLRSEEISKT